MKEDNNKYDSRLARQYCMYYGTLVGLLCSASFLCSVYGMQYPSLSLLGNLLGISAPIVAGHKIRAFRRDFAPIGFGRTCWMTLNIFFYAILLTAAVQYVFFAFLDHGSVERTLRNMMALPEYRTALEQMVGKADVDAILDSALSAFATPIKATMQLMWMNFLLALIAMLPTAIIGVSGRTQDP